MSLYRELRDALHKELPLGASSSDVQAFTAVGEVLIQSGRGTLDAVYLSASAAAGINLNFQDATATAQGVTPFFRVRGIAAGVWPVVFDRPFDFNKGLVLSYTASGAVTLGVTTLYRSTFGDPSTWAPGLP